MLTWTASDFFTLTARSHMFCNVYNPHLKPDASVIHWKAGFCREDGSHGVQIAVIFVGYGDAIIKLFEKPSEQNALLHQHAVNTHESVHGVCRSQKFHDEIPSVEQAKEAKNGNFLFLECYMCYNVVKWIHHMWWKFLKCATIWTLKIPISLPQLLQTSSAGKFVTAGLTKFKSLHEAWKTRSSS